MRIMRRKRCEIKERSEIDKILQRCRVGRMATLGGDGYPYITPVNYVYLEGSIYFHCARIGEKIDNIRRDARVCFEVDIPLAYLDLGYYGEVPEACNVTQFFHCVIIRGVAEIVSDISEKLKALNGLVASHEPEGRTFPEVTEDTPAVKLCEIVAIRIESVSGKRELAQSKDEQTREKLAAYLQQRGLPGDEEAARLITSIKGS